jgi:riboflavin synthase alpha subunit
VEFVVSPRFEVESLPAMFTGIVERIGRVAGPGKRLAVETGYPDLAPGASLAVNGVCLTIVRSDKGRSSFDVVAETLSRTNLGDLRKGDAVNLERPLRVGDRLDGHIVQGHVDGTGVVAGTGAVLRVETPLAAQLVPKGSVAVDGVSLTVVDVEPGAFTVALIPTTRRRSTLGKVRRGDRVNVEVDILSKYARRTSRLTKEFLGKAGF